MLRLAPVGSRLGGGGPGVWVSGCWGGRLGGLLESDQVDGLGRGEDVLGLGVSVGLPGEHAEIVLFEPVVVESFSGVVVVDDSVCRFCRGAQLVLDVLE